MHGWSVCMVGLYAWMLDEKTTLQSCEGQMVPLAAGSNTLYICICMYISIRHMYTCMYVCMYVYLYIYGVLSYTSSQVPIYVQ